jgi:hypothetical protein
MARVLADGSEYDHADTNPSGLLKEVEALRRRLAALEERLPGKIPNEPVGRQAKRRASTKTVVCLTTGTGLAILAGASLVYGQAAVQSAVDALTISKEGRIGIGTATPAATLDVVGGLLHVAGTTAPMVTSQGAYIGWNALSGGTGETDFINNQGQGAGGFAFMNTPLSGAPRNTLMFMSGTGDVGIGTVSPKDKLDVSGSARMTSLNVSGSARMTSLNVDGSAGMTTLNVTGSARITGLKVPGMGITESNVLEFGAGVTGKQLDAGKIGYQTFTTGALDIVGAGDAGTNRKIKFWAEGGATLAGSLNASGVVDGNMKVVYQRDSQTTYEKPLWRYHMSLTATKYGARTKTIPNEILTALCGKQDGCEIRLGMTRWDDASKTQTASIAQRFYYSPNDRRWRSSDPGASEGIIGNGATKHAMNAFNTCFFTDGTYNNYQDLGDKIQGCSCWSTMAMAMATRRGCASLP